MVPGVGRRDPARRMASSYPPAHAVAQPVQPSYHLLYHHFAAALTQPTSSVQMIPQPMFQSITTAPSLPMQSVPVPTLPKLMNDSERESTDLKMALAHLLNTHAELSERYKYRALWSSWYWRRPASCDHHTQPYTAAMQVSKMCQWNQTEKPQIVS